MANPEHVRIVRQGAESIARWREKHPGERLDLSGAGLYRANLAGADLRRVNLLGVDLSRADLGGANLRTAAARGATLFASNLTGASLRWTNLRWANLREANLSGANLSRAKLSGATLLGANLNEASLRMANLRWANLSEANLRGAEFNGAYCSGTVFSDCNLHQACGIRAIVHGGPSIIDVATIVAQIQAAGGMTRELEAFFLGTGVPTELLAALPRIAAEARYCSSFICYGEPDRAFAEKLVNDLRARGVSCWIYALDATPGKRTWKEIGEKRREAEKMVVLCSAQALIRDGVLKEIEEQIDEEPNKIVPISLDRIWMQPGFRVMRSTRDLGPWLRERNYADFSDPSKHEEALNRLLKALERKQEANS